MQASSVLFKVLKKTYDHNCLSETYNSILIHWACAVKANFIVRDKCFWIRDQEFNIWKLLKVSKNSKNYNNNGSNYRNKAQIVN